MRLAERRAATACHSLLLPSGKRKLCTVGNGIVSFSLPAHISNMAWGKGPAAGIDDLIKRLSDCDPKLQALTILRCRRLNDADVESLARAVRSNSILEELTLSSHSISAAASEALGAALQHNRGLKRISIGNSSWGDQVGAAAVCTGLCMSHGWVRANTAATISSQQRCHVCGCVLLAGFVCSRSRSQAQHSPSGLGSGAQGAGPGQHT